MLHNQANVVARGLARTTFMGYSGKVPCAPLMMKNNDTFRYKVFKPAERR